MMERGEEVREREGRVVLRVEEATDAVEMERVELMERVEEERESVEWRVDLGTDGRAEGIEGREAGMEGVEVGV
jgi:hypothetical protein